MTALCNDVHLAMWCSGVGVVGSALPLGVMSSMMRLGLRLRLPLPLHEARLTTMRYGSHPAIPFTHSINDPAR